MPKVSDLPDAATPLTGGETLPNLQGSDNAQATVAQSQVLGAVGGDLSTTDAPAGTMAYAVGLVGGNAPVWSDGIQFVANPPGGGSQPQRPARSTVRTAGMWIVGSGNPIIRSPARNVSMQLGFYWVSFDGFVWTGLRARAANNEFVKRGIEFISYANGCWLMSGQQGEGESSFIATSRNPPRVAEWRIDPPFGNAAIGAGTSPLAPTSYDDATGIFTVPVAAGPTQEIQNEQSSAVIPDPTWPHVGQNGAADPLVGVEGLGTAGPVEVRINTKQIRVTRQMAEEARLPNETINIWTSNFIEARRMAGGPFSTDGVYVQFLTPPSPSLQPLFELQLTGGSVLSAGLNLRGLVWAPLKQTAVLFQPGAA